MSAAVEPPRYWHGRKNICVAAAGVHLGCAHAVVLPWDGINVIPRQPKDGPRWCRRKLHDLNDPDNGLTSDRSCRRCRTMRGKGRIDTVGGKAAPRGSLPPRLLAYLRSVAACRACGAVPTDMPDGSVRIPHERRCDGEIDDQDRWAVVRRSLAVPDKTTALPDRGTRQGGQTGRTVTTQGDAANSLTGIPAEQGEEISTHA